MRPIAIATLFALAVALAWSGLWRAHDPATAGLAPDAPAPRTSHAVTPAMVAASGAMAAREIPDFRAEAPDARALSLREAAADAPVFLSLIKDGCPCSASAQPFYNRLHAAYGARARFLGVIDDDLDSARRWASASRVGFPILSDPASGLARACGAENSAYSALVAPGGRIEVLWPGYSSGILEEAGRRLATLSGVAFRPIRLADAPAEPLSGCPF